MQLIFSCIASEIASRTPQTRHGRWTGVTKGISYRKRTPPARSRDTMPERRGRWSGIMMPSVRPSVAPPPSLRCHHLRSVPSSVKGIQQRLLLLRRTLRTFQRQVEENERASDRLSDHSRAPCSAAKLRKAEYNRAKVHPFPPLFRYCRIEIASGVTGAAKSAIFRMTKMRDGFDL